MKTICRIPRRLAHLGLTIFVSLASAQANTNNSIATAQSLPLNVRSGSFRIGVARENDYYRFSVPDWGKLTVQSEGTTDTFGYLLGPSGNVISSDDDSGAGYNFKMTDVSVGPGFCYLRVRHYSSTATGAYDLRNSFTLAPRDDHGDTLATATPVYAGYHGQLLTGSIERGGDVDWFRIQVDHPYTSSDFPHVLLSAISTGESDMVGYLYDSTGRELVSNDDSYYGGVNFSVGVNLPNRETFGVYYLQVRNYYPDRTGAYGLKIVARADDHLGLISEVPTSASLNYTSTTLPGYIHGPGDTDLFRINVSGNGFLTAMSVGSTDVVGHIYDSAGQELLVNDDLSDSDRNFLVRVSVTAGTYYVRVRHYLVDAPDSGYLVNFRHER